MIVGEEEPDNVVEVLNEEAVDQEMILMEKVVEVK